MEKKRKKINFTQLIIMAILFIVIMFNKGINSETSVAKAATKPSISATKITIPVGVQKSGVYWVDTKTWDRGKAEKLQVKNKVKGAVYTFTSSDSKIIKISKDGGYLTGVKVGTATITCKQTLKKKTTTIGTCKVTVKATTLKTLNDIYDSDPSIAVNNGEYGIDQYEMGYDAWYYIGYRNPSAEYTFTSSSKNFTLKEVKLKSGFLEESIGGSYAYGYNYTVKEAGTYTITVNETYNKKTIKLGSFKVIVKDTYLSETEIELRLGEYMGVFDVISFVKPGTMYYFKVKDFDEINKDNNVVVLCYDDNDTEQNDLLLYAQKVGTAEITVTEGSETGKVIGTFTVKVYEQVCKSISLEEDKLTTYVGDEDFYVYFSINPDDTTDVFSIQSDNSAVLKVEYDEMEGWVYTPLKSGTANITIKCGEKTAVCKVVVEE